MEGGDLVLNGEAFWGDALGPRNDNLRVVYNNVDGLQIGEFLKAKIVNEKNRREQKALTGNKDTTKLTGVLSTIRSWGANVVCCAETQTAWKIFTVREKVESKLRRIDQYAGMVGSSSATATCNAYKPGGTLTIYDGNWSRRITKGIDSHKLGRWSYITLNGRNNSFLTIIIGYRVCQGQHRNSVGMNTAFMQQDTLLKKKGNKRTPQEMFIVDMTSFIEGLIAKGHEIIVALDANECWDSPHSRIQEMILKLGLFDIAKERHRMRVPNTYSRANSASRIDYIFGSENVLKNTVAFGMAPENYGNILGDHRPQYLDLNINALLDLNSKDIGSPTSRLLKSTDPKCVQRYVDTLKKHFEAHRVFERVEELWTELHDTGIMSQDKLDKYNAIDRDIYRLCTNAENGIKRKQCTKYVWSPQLDEAVRDVHYWMTRKRVLHNKSKTIDLVSKGMSNGHCDDVTAGVPVIEEEIQQAYARLKEIQKKDTEKRVEFLNSLAEKYALDNKIDKDTAIRELMSHEETRELFRTIRLRMHGTRPPQLSEVWVPDGDNKKIVISEDKEVETHLLQRNWSQLRQASNTPFVDGRLGGLINKDGTGDLADRIVDGDIIPEINGMKETVQHYIAGMKAVDDSILNTVKVEITMKEYRKFWANKREITVTSPFGLHIGHYKSVLGKEESDILDVHRIMLLIPFLYAMVPERWAQTIQILLEKDAGDPWSHRLRIIELFDAQVNSGLQIIFGQRMVRNALKHDQVHTSAYGSIPRRTAQDAVLEKILSLDLIRVKKISGAIFDCDAKGCYDRIIPALQSITCRRLGVPRITSLLFLRFGNRCKHCVRTRHGKSEASYSSSSVELLYGIGQVNGAGPAFWLSNLIVMFFVLDKLCSGMRFSSPWGDTSSKSTGIGYVDDVTLGCATDDCRVENDEIVANTKR